MTVATLGFASLLIALCAGDQVPPSAGRSLDQVAGVGAEYRIGPEDVITVIVLGHPEFTRAVPIRPDGRISLPMVNDVEVGGLTAGELRAALTTSFKRFIKEEILEVSVIIDEVNSPRVSVLGQVRTPIRFVLRSPTTLLEALAIAGGWTEFAKRDRIQVHRADGSRLTFNFDRFVERQEANENILLRAGDIIIVP